MCSQIIISGSQDIQVANSKYKETMFEGYIHKNSFFGRDPIN